MKRPEVSAIVLVERSMIINDKGEALFVQRANDDSSDPGMWEFPGGKQDVDELLEETREREAWEETGLKTVPIGNGLVHVQENIKDNGKHYIVRTSLCEATAGVVKLRDEHDDSMWLEPHEAESVLELTSYCKLAMGSMIRLLEQRFTETY